MNTPCQRIPLLLSLVALVTLTACGQDAEELQNTKSLPLDTAVIASSNELPNMIGNELPDMIGSDSTLSAIIGASEIPYPVYPNGKKYRVGGENGLKIVVFQTKDTFNQVDAFYNAYYSGDSNDDGMPRLTAMSDYVRYSTNTEDTDPWATFRPGIVIHEFNNSKERNAVGAKDSAQTNIIMSF